MEEEPEGDPRAEGALHCTDRPGSGPIRSLKHLECTDRATMAGRGVGAGRARYKRQADGSRATGDPPVSRQGPGWLRRTEIFLDSESIGPSLPAGARHSLPAYPQRREER